jgi:hypothetical protein
MMKRTYSHEIAEAISNYLNNNDLKHNFNKSLGVFTFSAGVTGKIKTLYYELIVNKTGFTSCAHYPLGPDSDDEEARNLMAQFLTRANYGMRIGNFQMEMDEGDISYKVYCSCLGMTVSDEMIAESIHCSAAMFAKYEPGILGILFGGMTAKQAADRCEWSIRTSLEELKARLEQIRRSGEQKMDSGIVDQEEEQVDW